MYDLIKTHSPDLNEKDIKILDEFIREEKTPLKPIFNLKGFIFGWFYLLYKKAYMEALAVIVISLLFIQIAFILHSFLFLFIGSFLPNIIVGWYFYFMYANKISRDIENCGKPIDKECLSKKGGRSIVAVVGTIFIIIFLFWPVIYGKITKQDVTTEQNKYINKIEKVIK